MVQIGFFLIYGLAASSWRKLNFQTLEFAILITIQPWHDSVWGQV